MAVEGILYQRRPIYWTRSPATSGARTLLPAGRWNYLSIVDQFDELATLGTFLDGIDTTALAGAPTLVAQLVETLEEEGALEVVLYDTSPPLLLTVEMALAIVLARCFALIMPRRAMAFIARRLETDDRPPPTWAGGLGEQILAAQHRAAVFPGVTTKCIPVAIATYWLLRRRRQPAAFRLAIANEPFEAHVWVTHDGRDLDPRSEAFAGSLIETLVESQASRGTSRCKPIG